MSIPILELPSTPSLVASSLDNPSDPSTGASSARSSTANALQIYLDPEDAPTSGSCSPAASTKAIFRASRRASAMPPYDDDTYTWTAGPEDLLAHVDAALATWRGPAAEATGAWAAAQARTPTRGRDDSDARSLFAPSVFTIRSRRTLTPGRFFKRAAADADAGPASPRAPAHDPAPRRWPSATRLRKTVSGLLGRREDRGIGSAPPRPVARRNTSAGLAATPVRFVFARAASLRAAPAPVSSASFTDDAPDAAAALMEPAPVCGAARTRIVRRSASFSGFASMLAPIEDDADLDEATAEARGVADSVARAWEFTDAREPRALL